MTRRRRHHGANQFNDSPRGHYLLLTSGATYNGCRLCIHAILVLLRRCFRHVALLSVGGSAVS